MIRLPELSRGLWVLFARHHPRAARLALQLVRRPRQRRWSCGPTKPRVFFATLECLSPPLLPCAFYCYLTFGDVFILFRRIHGPSRRSFRENRLPADVQFSTRTHLKTIDIGPAALAPIVDRIGVAPYMVERPRNRGGGRAPASFPWYDRRPMVDQADCRVGLCINKSNTPGRHKTAMPSSFFPSRQIHHSGRASAPSAHRLPKIPALSTRRCEEPAQGPFGPHQSRKVEFLEESNRFPADEFFLRLRAR